MNKVTNPVNCLVHNNFNIDCKPLLVSLAIVNFASSERYPITDYSNTLIVLCMITKLQSRMLIAVDWHYIITQRMAMQMYCMLRAG